MSENLDTTDTAAQNGPFPHVSVDITLTRPITVAGQRTSTITLREPTLAQAEFLDKVRFRFDQDGGGEVQGMGTTCLEAAVHLGGLTHNEARQISAADIMAIWTAVMGFLMGSRGTGAKP